MAVPYMTGEACGSGTWYFAIMSKTSIFYEDFGSSILSLSLTLNVEL
jgi:hypothetical protein